MRRFWLWFLAYWHLNDAAVCAMSTDRRDYHDYPDDIHGQPWHFYTMTCKRCGRKFSI